MDLDIENSSISTILGVRKRKKKNKEKINQLNISIIKIRKNIDLLKGAEIIKAEVKSQYFKIEEIIKQLKETYSLIIVDTVNREDFKELKSFIENSEQYIFLIEPNLIEIKKANNLISNYIKKFSIKKEKIKLIFNKININSISENILLNIFSEFKILGGIKYNRQYNLIINKNNKYNIYNKRIEKQYNKIIKQIYIN